jgi:hypothetical protein
MFTPEGRAIELSGSTLAARTPASDAKADLTEANSKLLQQLEKKPGTGKGNSRTGSTACQCGFVRIGNFAGAS